MVRSGRLARLARHVMPLVSVVVPTHNRAARLEKAIRSALGQTVGDLEILVVDDGSSDGTPDVIGRLSERDARVRAIRLSAGSGAAAARNAGIRAATGEFLAFLDDDDEWASEKVEEQIGYLRAHPDVGLVSCNFLVVGEGRPALHRGPERFTAAALLWANVLMGCSFVMLRRPSFSFEPNFDESLVTAEDWDLWLRCSDERAVATVPSPLARYALHAVQLSSSVDRVQRGESAFFAKNERRMSANARAFHRAHLLLLGASGERERMRARMTIIRETPPAVIRVLARLAWSRRLGRGFKDPGRPVRTLVREVARID